MKNKSYNEMCMLNTFEDRFNYLKEKGKVGFNTFGFDRYLNQNFYKSKEWKKIRDEVIVRDNGCDLGIKDRPISGKIYVHHINRLEEKDICDSNEKLLDPNNLICVSLETHNAIHYGNIDNIPKNKIEARSPNDTCPWKK